MNAIIIYDEASRAHQAIALLNRAADRAGEASQWTFNAWRVDILEHPLLAEELLQHGLEAHLLLLAVAPQTELPSSLLKWLETWAAHRWVGDAALALFNGGFGNALSATAPSTLLDLTERHRLSFISGNINPADNKPVPLPQPDLDPAIAYTAAMTHSQAERSWELYQH